MSGPKHTRRRGHAARLQQASRAFLQICCGLRERVWSFAKTWRPRFNSATKVVAGRAVPPHPEAGDLAGRLTEEKDFLLALVRGMETEFLATGRGLMRLAQQLNEIQQPCQSLTDLTLGRTQDAAVPFAFQLLKKAEDLVLASYDQYDHVFATFGELQQRLAQLTKQHDELMRVLLPLSFITLAFRIEASRHPAQVREAFFTLAASVNGTLSEVRGTLERQFDELAASERIARALMEQVSASIQAHRKEVTATLDVSRRQLRSLSEALTCSGAGAADLSQLNQAVNRHIGGVVMAQQCQDITRQTLEHVGEAMDEMRTHLGDGRTAADSDTRQFVFRAGQIQLHQVQKVFDQLNGAADSLKSGIQSLRSDAGAAAEAAVKLGGTTLDAQVASQCQAGIGEVLGIVNQAVRKIAFVIAAFEPLQASFVDCTGKATALASDVGRAGLNAQVFAIHAPDGATLEVLAGRMRAVSAEVLQQVEQMGAALSHTGAMVNNLRHRLEDFQILGQAEQELLNVESVLSQNRLSDLEGAIPVLLRDITQQQETFAQSVEVVLANVRFPATVAEASSRSMGFFRELIAWASEGRESVVVEAAASEQIHLLQTKYTMESERLAHAAALQPLPASGNATASQASIELFGELESTRSPAAADLLLEPDPSNQPRENPPGPAGTGRRLESAQALASEPPAASEGLGDNVELF